MSSPSIIGVDLGGTSLRAAVVSAQGAVSHRLEQPTRALEGADVLVDQIAGLVREVAGQSGSMDISGIGLCTPGPFDTDQGIALGVPTLPGFRDFPLKMRLQAKFEWPVHVENDAAAAAFGEWRFGAGRQTQTMVYVTVSTGIGGGVIDRGRLLRGRQGLAGHLGHMAISDGGPICSCGRAGCWEAFASGTALNDRARDAGLPSAAKLFDAARMGQAAALQMVEQEAHYLALGLANIVHIFSPEIIVLGGGVSHGFDLMSDRIHDEITAMVMPAFTPIKIASTELKLNAGIIGAAALAAQELSDDRSVDVFG